MENELNIDAKHIDALLAKRRERLEYVAAIASQYEEAKHKAETELLRIENAEKEAMKDSLKEIGEIESKIETFFQDPESLGVPLNPDRQEYNSPYGTVSFKEKRLSLGYADREEFLQFCKANLSEVTEEKVTVSVPKNDVKALINDEGFFVTDHGELLHIDDKTVPFSLSEPGKVVNIH